MKLINSYFTANPYATDGRYLTGPAFKGFFLHSVGTAQPDPLVFLRNWDKATYTSAGINGFIGGDGVYITAPCLETSGQVKRMPHAGVRATNDSYIGFEMCEPAQLQYNQAHSKILGCTDKGAAVAFAKSTYENAVELFAQLCAFHGKDPLEEGVIYSHSEGAKLGIASGHVDPEHIWNYLGLGYTMNTFRKAVAAAMEDRELYRVRRTWADSKSQLGAYADKDNAISACPEGYCVFDSRGKLIYEHKEEETMTQETFNQLLANALALEGTGDQPSAWAKEACGYCKEQGIFSGDDKGSYGWQKPITREQAAVLIYLLRRKSG